MERSSMGETKKKKRGRVKLARIEDKISRQVRFSKRKSGLFKKSFELAVLCDAEVALLVFSPAGRLFEFSSCSSIEKTMKRYQQFMCTKNDATDKVPTVNNSTIKNDENTCSSLDFKSTLLKTASWVNQNRLEQPEDSELEKLQKMLVDALNMMASMKKQREREVSFISSEASRSEEEK